MQAFLSKFRHAKQIPVKYFRNIILDVNNCQSYLTITVLPPACLLATSMLSQYPVLSPCTLSTRSWKEGTEQAGVAGPAREFTARLRVCQYTEFVSCQRYVRKQNYIPNFSPKSSSLKTFSLAAQ